MLHSNLVERCINRSLFYAILHASFCIIRAHKYLHHFYSRKRKFTLVPQTFLFLLQFLTTFFFFFLVKFQLQRKKDERRKAISIILVKIRKVNFHFRGIHFRVYPARYHPLTMFICDRQQAVQARGNARPLFPDCKPRFRVTWVTCLPRAHRPPGWANQPIRRFNCFICQFCPRTSLKLGSARQ